MHQADNLSKRQFLFLSLVGEARLACGPGMQEARRIELICGEITALLAPLSPPSHWSAAHPAGFLLAQRPSSADRHWRAAGAHLPSRAAPGSRSFSQPQAYRGRPVMSIPGMKEDKLGTKIKSQVENEPKSDFMNADYREENHLQIFCIEHLHIVMHDNCVWATALASKTAPLLLRGIQQVGEIWR